MRKLFYIIFLTLIPVVLSAQTSRDSLSFQTSFFRINNLRTSFSKQLNTFNLNTNAVYNYNNDKIFVGFNDRFLSTVVKSDQKSIKDEHHIGLLTEYKIINYLNTGIKIESSNYSDDRRLDINNTSNVTAIFFAKIKPENNFQIIPYGGYSNNGQVNQKDKGWIYGTDGSYMYQEPNRLRINSIMKFQNEDISPRKNTFRFLKLNAISKFQEFFNNNFTVRYNEQRKDFYFKADSVTTSVFDIENNIQSRIESQYFIQDRLTILPSQSGFSFDLAGSVSKRKIDRNTRYLSIDNLNSSNLSTFPFSTNIDELALNFSGVAEYSSDKFMGAFKIAFTEREEKHLLKNEKDVNQILFEERERIESRKNNKSQYTTLTFLGNLNLSENDDLIFSLFHRKLIYDTPSENNSDDRDELLSMFRLSYIKRLSPFFNIYFNLEGSYNHLVYIFSERSANNNIKRVLKFVSGSSYRTKVLSSTNTAEISANYTVFDFEDLTPNFKSFSFRQLAFKDSTVLNVIRKVNLEFNGYVKLSEQGDFKWTSFSNKPQRFIAEFTLEPMVKYLHYDLHMGIGLRVFNLSTFKYDNENIKALDTEYTSIGPVSEISYVVHNRIRLKFYGWYEFIKNQKNIRREQITMNLNVNWNF